MGEFKRFQFRSKDNFMKYVKIELALLKKEWMVILPCVIMQYVHGVFHNLAYWIQGNKLSTQQRFALHDLGFDLMPELSEANSHLSEYFVFGVIFAPSILLVLTIPLFRQNPNKPRYLVIVLKRVLLHISIALFFRICSFLLTSLPGPARQCRLNFNETCLAQNPDAPALCVIPNPEFKPPTGSELFTNMDALKGCGDLMFSSHTIYTLSFILTVAKYWWNKYLVTAMVCVQIAIAFLIVASRKHYSLDVFSALYIVPLLWLTQDAYLKDINNKDTQVTQKTIHEFYGVDVSPDLESEQVLPLQQGDEEQAVTATTPSSGDSEAPFKRKNSM